MQLPEPRPQLPAPRPTPQATFEEWVRGNAGILHHVVNGFASGDDRNDLMQELLLAVWKSIPAFRGESRVSTFLHRVTHNAAMTWRRKNRTYERKIGEFRMEPPAGEETAADPAVSADANGPAADRLEMLYREIRRLPALDRSLVLLSLDGLSYAEMAAIHGLSESNTGVRLTRARQKLALAVTAAANGNQPVS